MTLLPPTVEQQRRTDQEISPDPEMRKRDIQNIRDWIAKQPHLPNKHMGDYYFNFFQILIIVIVKQKYVVFCFFVL